MNEDETGKVKAALSHIYSNNSAAVQLLSHHKVCSLWAGFGSIYDISTTTNEHFIVKSVALPQQCTSIGDLRKKKSYECEANFYDNGVAERLLEIGCAVPRPLHVNRTGTITICMTKLTGTASSNLSGEEAAACMKWFANLHSEYWGSKRADAAVAQGCQVQGTYWYLDTRPDEFDAMPNHGWEGQLKKCAKKIDGYLRTEECFPTILHGDGKGANMLFATDSTTGVVIPQLYDFQYCGKGSCMKDLAYFLTCAVTQDKEEVLMSTYHHELKTYLRAKWNEEAPTLHRLQEVLEVCIADLGRFMSGWGWWGNAIKQRIGVVLEQDMFRQ